MPNVNVYNQDGSVAGEIMLNDAYSASKSMHLRFIRSLLRITQQHGRAHSLHCSAAK